MKLSESARQRRIATYHHQNVISIITTTTTISSSSSSSIQKVCDGNGWYYSYNATNVVLFIYNHDIRRAEEEVYLVFMTQAFQFVLGLLRPMNYTGSPQDE